MMTIGHSTLELEAFLRALAENGCSTLVDVRRFPGSRRYPQFGQERLFASLEGAGIRGVWRVGLGGRRAARRDSVNTGWRNESFRGYADYMQTAEFAAEIDWLMGLPDLATGRGDVCGGGALEVSSVADWGCHAGSRRGGGGYLRDGHGGSSRRPHEMTEFARVEGERVWYPGVTEGGLFD